MVHPEPGARPQTERIPPVRPAVERAALRRASAIRRAELALVQSYLATLRNGAQWTERPPTQRD
jgi:hypothetical protein